MNLESLSAQQREALLSRLRQLCAKALPYVSLPSEIVLLDTSRLFILGTRHGRSLQECVKSHSAAITETSELRHWVTTSLIGLAALHSCDTVHGDIRPANLFLDSPERKSSQVMYLGDTAIGTLGWLSDGRWCDPQTKDFFPPEWHQGWQEPSKSADVYALGLSILQLCKGTEERIARHANGKAHRPRWGSMVDTFLGDGLETLIDRMTASEESERFANGCDALAWWEGHGHRQRKGQVWALVMGIVVLFFFEGWSRSISDGQIAKLRSERDAAMAQVALKRQELSAKTKEGRTPVSESTLQSDDRNTPPIKDPAAVLWERIGRKKVEVILADPKHPDYQLAQLATQWIKNLREFEIQPEFQAWQAYDFRGAERLRESWQKLGRKPWEGTRATAVERDLVHLTQASDIWRTWANKRAAKLDSIQLMATNVPNDEVRKILREWLASMNAVTQATVRLTRGKSKSWGKNRYVTINAGEPSNFPWSDNTSHDYGPDALVGPIPWQAGDKLTISVDVDRIFRGYLYLPNIVNETFDGPLALWKAHDAGVAHEGGTSKGATASLEFEIVDCPGPPPSRLFKTLSKPIDELVQDVLSPLQPDPKSPR